MSPAITFTEVDVAEIEGRAKRGLPLFRVEKDIYVSLFGRHIHTIRRGFVTDKTSWPRSLRMLLGWTPLVKKWLTDPDRKYEFPAIFHDDLLENTDYPKWAVDLFYKAALRSNNVSAIEAAIFGGAVRIKRNR